MERYATGHGDVETALVPKRCDRRSRVTSRLSVGLPPAILALTLAAPVSAQTQRSASDQTRPPFVATAAPIDVNVTVGATPLPPPPDAPPPPPPDAPPPPPPEGPPPPPFYYPPPPPPPPPGPPPTMILVEPPLRWGVQVRLGYGVPIGSVFNQALSDVAGGLFDLEGAGDLVLYRRVVLGLQVGGGVAAPGQNGLDTGQGGGCTNCNAWTFDIGIHTEYRFLPPPSRINPWVGLALSYEVLGVGNGSGLSTTFSGTDVDFTGGCDFQLGPFGLGPFITSRVGRYTSESVTVNGMTSDVVGDGAPWHGWLLLGVRARY